MAVLDLRGHPGYPSGSDTLARAFFGVSLARFPAGHEHFSCWQEDSACCDRRGKEAGWLL